MESLFSSVQSIVDAAIPMIVLLGLLIFVHELGHFLVAKYFKVRVEVFSLGFGPKIFKFKRGETVYAISAIPLGGYVKMFGDDTTAAIDDEQKKYSFLHKPVGQRIAVVLAGPLMNFFFAVLIFTIVALHGEQTFAPQVGDIAENSQAYAQGFRSGDKVTTVNGAEIQSWDQLHNAIEKNADQVIAIQLLREGASTPETIQITPKLVPNKNVLSWDRMVGEVEGLSPSSKSSFVGVRAGGAAAQAGLKTGDLVKTVNGKPVEHWRNLDQILRQSAGSPLEIEVERGRLTQKDPEATPETAKVSLKAASLVEAGIDYPELYLASIEKDSPAEKAGLKIGDRLVAINDQPVKSFEEVAGIIRSGSSSGDDAKQTLKVLVARDGSETTVTVAPNIRERMNNQGKEERRFEIGIRPMIVDAQPDTTILQTTGLIAAVQRGFSQTMRWTNLTILSFVRLAQAEVSPKNIGGFFSIGSMAKRSWQIGLSQYLNVMALISINLFILNLLPIPVLDGGHLVFYTVEAIKGAPLSLRKMEIAQQVGLVLLLGLMVFALYNDISRFIFS
ncbi:MAG TPA: RIP metalloprotease RseP [Bdellovibrionales bacterium]|nr:RIP metalloprotease RseP [Bdellovibrionales bacterium]